MAKLTMQMRPAGIARRLELLAAQIRMGRRHAESFSIGPVVEVQIDGDNHRTVTRSGLEGVSIVVTELESARRYRARIRGR